jgi:hypothetical protein
MREGIFWLLSREMQYPSGARSPREVVGIFSTPDAAFQVMRDHPDFQGVQVAWHAAEWHPISPAYFGWATTELLRRPQLWEISVVPLLLDDPVFDFPDEREAYDRIRWHRR